jgi:hypothetical protein
MNVPPTTSTQIAALGEYHVAVAADRNHTPLATICPGNPPTKTVRMSRCAAVISIVMDILLPASRYTRHEP